MINVNFISPDIIFSNYSNITINFYLVFGSAESPTNTFDSLKLFKILVKRPSTVE